MEFILVTQTNKGSVMGMSTSSTQDGNDTTTSYHPIGIIFKTLYPKDGYVRFVYDIKKVNEEEARLRINEYLNNSG